MSNEAFSCNHDLGTKNYLLIRIGNAEFQNLENCSEPQRADFSARYAELSKKTMQIVVNQKVQVMFHINDKVFTRSQCVDDDEFEMKEEWSRCNCCGAKENIRKFKNW